MEEGQQHTRRRESRSVKIVVPGALGHIGSHIVRKLPSQFPGAEIVMIDNLMTQRFPSLFNLPAIGCYRFIDGDVTEIDLRPVFDDADMVIHLAAVTDAASSFSNAKKVEANNLEATRNVAEACCETGARLIQVSSTSVYGTQRRLVSEDCSIDELRPQSPYAKIKLKEEELTRNLVSEKGLRAICCRLGTIFGVSPGIRFHTAVNRFCWQAALGQPITVWRTAYDQKRPYLDLIDAGRAISFIIEKGLFDGQIYNVVTVNTTVRTIVEIIKSMTPRVELKFVDSPIMNQLSFEVSPQRFIDHGFFFTGNLLRGIKKTIALLRRANSAA
jgi:UDP-glucose 4-epimerase